MPTVEAIGIGASICAPSNSPIATLSRMLAHDDSRTTVTSRPSCAKKPFSRATTTGAESFSAMIPSVKRAFSGVPVCALIGNRFRASSG